MSAFDKIKTGLEEAIAFEKGALPGAKTTTLSISPLSKYSASEIKEIRKNTGYTQVVFAQFMGVSVKTIEAWGRAQSPRGGGLPSAGSDQKGPYLPAKIRHRVPLSGLRLIFPRKVCDTIDPGN